MAEVEIGPELMKKAFAHPDIEPALRQVAEGIAARARALTASEKITMQVHVVSGTRPRGRQYANVVGDNPGQEWGNNHTSRRRILGRAAQGG